MSSRLALCVALTLALAVPAWGAHAAALLPGDEAVIDLRVNEQPQPTAFVVRRDTAGGVWVRAADLETLQLRPDVIRAVPMAGDDWYRLDDIPGARLAFDAATQSLDALLPATAFVRQHVSRSARSTTPGADVSPGAFLNYDLSIQQTSEGDENGAFLELGAFGRHGLLTSTLAGVDREQESSVTRLETAWSRDYADRLATLSVGDVVSSSGAWGRSARLGGIQFATNFGTQPTLVTTPLLTARGEAIVPSTVDVFVNGQQVASEQVAPGPFELDRVPAISGAGQLQVVVTDALGRQQVISQPYYTGPSLLRAGLDAYSFEFGAIREDYGIESNRYGDVVLAGTFRRGLTDRLTGELHGEAQAGGAAAFGADVAWQPGTLGTLSGTAAFGGDDNKSGWLAGVGFERSGPRVNVFARTQYTSEQFVQLGTYQWEQRPRQRTFGGVGVNLGRAGSVQLAGGLQSHWSAPQTRTVGLNYSVSLGPFGFVSLAADHSQADDDGYLSVFLGWSMALGSRRTAGLSLRHTPDDDAGESFEAVASLQQSLPAGSGNGFQVTASSNDDYLLGVSHQGRAGLVAAEYAQRDASDGWRLNGVGGLAVTGGGVFPARWLDRSFAVVRVADYPSLTVFVDNQPIGRTDDKGRVLIDTLRAYELNEVSVDPSELPLSASLASPVMHVTPGFRSGAVVEFPVRHASAVTFRLVDTEGVPVPGGATVQLASGAQSPVGLDGLVYVEEGAGFNEAVARWRDHVCHFSFQRTGTTDPQPDLGTIRCTEPGR